MPTRTFSTSARTAIRKSKRTVVFMALTFVGSVSQIETVAARTSDFSFQPATATTSAVSSSASGCSSADYRTGWSCMRVDHFSGTALNTTSSGWMVYDSPKQSHPRSKNNVRVRNGELQLVGTYNQSTKVIQGAGIADRFSQKYGRWEVRMRVDAGAGFSAAALLWPTYPAKWPNDGEIDIVEIPKSDRLRVHNFVHNGPSNAQQGSSYAIDAKQWHTYAVEWWSTGVYFFIDGKQVSKVTDRALVPDTAPMHLALQFDAQRIQDGCSGWYQCPSYSTPAETIMHVDYIRAWKKA